MPKISVIVPAYNMEDYLKRCLDSIIHQTLKDIEIVCIDDGSTDNSLLIFEEYAANDDRIKIYSQENLGLSAARNSGIAQSTGEYIGFVDSDDFVDLDFYEKLYNAAIENDADISCGNIVRENEKKRKTPVKYSKSTVACNTKEKYILAGLPMHNYVWNKIYKREALVKSNIKFINGVLYEDMYFSPDVLESLGKLVTVTGTYYHYWINKTSIIACPTDKNRSDAINAHKYLIKKCKQYNLKDENINLISKDEYFLFGLKILKVYNYHATKKYSLFGILPIMEMRSR